MPSVLGKRKARVAEPKEATEDVHDIFRKHFEAQFKPLRTPKKPKPVEEEPEEEKEADDDAWDGLSDDDDEEDTAPAIEVVDHTGSQAHDTAALMSKRELKAFMSSRPPSAVTKPAPAAPEPESDDETERTLRAQDLALQRLLSESHLLSSYTPDGAHSTGASQKLFASGKLRHRTTDMRIQALATSSAPLSKAPDSLFEQKKMPMAMRKRLVATRGAREDKRRREAKENGIILEREKKKPDRNDKSKRERAIDGPEVGRMRGAELRLSERDVRNIEGSGGRGGRGGKGGRGGGRGGRGGGGRR